MRPCVSRLFRAFAVVSLAAGTWLLAGCDGRQTTGPATSSPPATVRGPDHRFPLVIGGQTVQLRLAVSDPERAQGLMYITQMPEDEGMLFVFPKPQVMSFYMRSTRLPLDIGFIDTSGVLREVRPMYPGIEDSVISSAPDLQLALEMNQGWFARHDIKPGATIDLAAVKAALHERGFNPAKIFRAR